MSIVYPVIFTQIARMELIEAQDWYEGEAAGLGRRFREAINTLVGRMCHSPRQFPIVYKNVRRAVLPRFPYSLFFVIACFHGSRDPLQWAAPDIERSCEYVEVRDSPSAPLAASG